MIAPMPGAVPLKPGSGTLPMPGIDARHRRLATAIRSAPIAKAF